MSKNLTGMLWLTRPGDNQERRLGDAVEYAEQKYGRPVQAIHYPTAETYPAAWRGIPLEPSRRVQAHHLYLVLDRATQARPVGAGDLPAGA